MITIANLTTTYNGLADDTKPTTDVRNGDVFVEIDTGDIYMFDEENSTWNKTHSESSASDDTQPDNG